MTTIDLYGRLAEKFTFDNYPLLASATVSFALGYMEYYYAAMTMVRTGKGSMPYWMHSIFLAHDTAWAYALAKAAPRYGDHWFFQATSTALMVWAGIEVFCLWRGLTVNREETFKTILGPKSSFSDALLYGIVLLAVSYGVVILGMIFMGEGCMLQWFCLTDILLVVGPGHEYLRRGSREGLPTLLCFVNIGVAVMTFAPFGLWALVLPEVFDQPAYYFVGCLVVGYSLYTTYVVMKY
ncbi:hypothetical protein BX600DRAFT_438396 [Xylariales sp. PMI_506]|nr:hypothetical protein BX600DRAFT_438396 [Xylariales sp. PMI_506]